MDAGLIIPGKITALDGVLLRFVCEAQPNGRYVIPSRVNGYELKQIGSGCVCMGQTAPVISQTPAQLRVGSGYTALKPNCFNMAGLKVLYLPETLESAPSEGNLQINSWVSTHRNRSERLIDRIVLRRRLDRSLRDALLSQAIMYSDTVGHRKYLLTDQFLLDAPRKLYASLARVMGGIPVLSRDMRYVLRLRDQWFNREDSKFWAELMPTQGIEETMDYYDLSARYKAQREVDLAMLMIREGFMGWRDEDAERENDNALRKGRAIQERPNLQRWAGCGVPAVTVDLGSVTRNGNAEYVDVNFERSVLFTPALRHLRVNGRDYFVYSRNFLTGDRECPYIRCEMCVFDQSGIVRNRGLATEVYAKYKLLSIL